MAAGRMRLAVSGREQGGRECIELVAAGLAMKKDGVPDRYRNAVFA